MSSSSDSLSLPSHSQGRLSGTISGVSSSALLMHWNLCRPCHWSPAFGISHRDITQSKYILRIEPDFNFITALTSFETSAGLHDTTSVEQGAWLPYFEPSQGCARVQYSELASTSYMLDQHRLRSKAQSCRLVSWISLSMGRTYKLPESAHQSRFYEYKELHVFKTCAAGSSLSTIVPSVLLFCMKYPRRLNDLWNGPLDSAQLRL